MVSLRELRQEILALPHNNGREFEADVNLILMHTLKTDKTQLILGTRRVSQVEYSKIHSSIKKLAGGVPVSYIIGCCEFMSLEFNTPPGVLIPRADTEVLVEAVMQRLDSDKEYRIADICCGSGCIGISLAHYMKNVSVTAFDISDTAIAVTLENAENHSLSDRVKTIRADILKEFPDTSFDCIVSNPPYIRTDVIKELDAKVRDREPLLALDGGDDGLIFYRRIAESASLTDGGIIAFEIGYDQGKEVSDILAENGYKNIEITKDIENRDRVVTATKYR